MKQSCSTNNNANTHPAKSPSGDLGVMKHSCSTNIKKRAALLPSPYGEGPGVRTIYLITLLILTAGLQTIHSQSANQNYILTKTYTSATAHLDRIDYFDGLGRPVETVQKQFTPNGKDLVALTGYDNFGRPEKTWLPAPNTKTDGSYNGASTAATFYTDAYPYSQTVYEASPLNRPAHQYGPGAAWRSGSGHKITSEYLTNTNQSGSVLSCGYYYMENESQIRRNGFYAAGTLYVNKITDEDGNVSYEFKDKLERVVLERSIVDNQNIDIYYIYNDSGKLAFVLPPIASDNTQSNASYPLWSHAYLYNCAYVYVYDKRGRMESKKIAGHDMENFIYDRADRLAMDQTAAADIGFGRGWLFYKYDALGRVILSGIYHGDDNNSVDVNMKAYNMRNKYENENILSVESPVNNNSQYNVSIRGSTRESIRFFSYVLFLDRMRL